MKHLFKVTLFAAGMLAAAHGKAQTHSDSTLGHKLSKTAKKVGTKTSELAAKGAAAVTDKKYDGKMGPGGETIYINSDSKYYYVDKSGRRVYVNKSSLRDKPSQ